MEDTTNSLKSSAEKLWPISYSAEKHAHVDEVEGFVECPVGFEIVDEELNVRTDTRGGVVSRRHLEPHKLKTSRGSSLKELLRERLDRAQVNSDNLSFRVFVTY